MIRLSKTSKLDGILSWSLEALETCPGSKGIDGELVDACSGCYATTGNYRFTNVKKPRLENKTDWKRPNWVSDMVQALQGQSHFRWFDSGDMYSIELARKILAVMESTPETRHWLPTRMHKFPKFRPVLFAMADLPNVSVRFSSDSVDGTYSDQHGSVIVPSADNVPEGAQLCQAYSHDGKCNGCRACWDKQVPVIAYPAHGRKMAKIVRLKLVS